MKVTERNKNGSVDQIMADIWDSYKITKCDITEEGQWIELPKHCTKDKKNIVKLVWKHILFKRKHLVTSSFCYTKVHLIKAHKPLGRKFWLRR